jgi:O-methyltransferase involved in polyketide biosynthesis
LTTEGSRDARIGPTAHFTAHVWSRLGLPHADLFATPLGAALFWALRAAGEWAMLPLRRMPSIDQYLELRHRTLDHALAELNPDRIVEIGAGLSRRGVSWAADRGVTYYEVDLPHMIATKRARLQKAPEALRARIEGKLHQQSVDILDKSFGSWLGEVFEGAERPAVVAEGLIGYFELPEKLRIVSSVREGLQEVGGGAFVCDLRTDEGGLAVRIAARLLSAAIRLITAGRGTGSNFDDHAAVHRFFAAAGFESSNVVDATLAVPHLADVRSVSAIWSAQVGSHS